jgi:AcrR family transcriptional regulator
MANRKTPAPVAAPAAAPARERRVSARPRVRRGSQDDARKLHDELLAAALALFIEGGLPAVTMRAVATRVDVSAMTPYRYFEDKGALLQGIWAYAIEGARSAMRDAGQQVPDLRERICAELGAFIDYWESNPDQYRLVYMTEQTSRRDQADALNALPAYTKLTAASIERSRQLAEAIGGDPANAKLATDMRVLMLGGYLQGRLVNRRYPWSPVDVLRPAFLDSVLAAMDTCLRRGQAGSPQKS